MKQQLAMVPTAAVRIDGARFQFRTFAHHDTMKAVTRWNADLAGTISAWVDPADQLIYVIDGHHRVALAQRLNVPELAVRFMKAKTAKQARLAGAAINIAGGRASAIDAAKVLRDSKVDPVAYGLPPGGAVLRDGLKLAALAPELFDAVCTGGMEVSMGLALAGAGRHSHQRELWAMAQKQRWSPAATAEAAEISSLASTRTRSSCSIPGLDLMVEDSNFQAILQVRAALRRRLRGEIRALGAASRARDAAILTAAGNKIDRQESRAARAEAQLVSDVFARLINCKGPLADLVKMLADEVGTSRSALAVVDDNLDLLRSAIKSELKS